MALVDSAGRRLRLGREIGRGGEGAIHEIIDEQRVIAKMFLRPLDAAKQAKIAWMAANPVPAVAEQTAWPIATIHRTAGGPVIGFSMQRYEGFKSVHLAYSPASRAVEFPDRDFSFLLHIAFNVACAFEAVHRAGHLVCDVNENNVLVSPGTATARLIDCDSFQIDAGNVVYPSGVGVARFTPPELQNRHLRVERTVHHDGFGLSVLLFHLLFLGRHPFDGIFLGRGEMTSERAIAEYRFAYGAGALARQMRPPPVHLPFDAVPEPIRELFERAFSPQGAQVGRPLPSEWSSVLRATMSGLRRCSVDRAHVFTAATAGCPWCTITSATGAIFFASSDSLDLKISPNDVAQFAALTNKLRLRRYPLPLHAGPPSETTLPAALGKNLKSSRGIAAATLVATGVAALGWHLFFLVPSAAAIAILIAASVATGGLFLAGRLLEKRTGTRRFLAERVAAARAAAESLTRDHDGYMNLATKAEASLQTLCDEVDQLRVHYEALAGRHEAALRAMAEQREENARKQGLRNLPLSQSEIEGIGPAVKQLLRSFGIETAWDVLNSMPNEIRGLGDARRARLLSWARAAAYRAVQSDPNAAVPRTERAALTAQFRKEQALIRARLEASAAELRRGAEATWRQMSEAQKRVEAAQEAAWQVRSPLPVRDEVLARESRPRFYERAPVWLVLAAECALFGLGASFVLGRPAARMVARAEAQSAEPFVLISECALYSSASIWSSQVGMVSKGAEITIEARHAGWIRVRTASGMYGWTNPRCWRPATAH
jgi:DNA-binding helix-hairpin-helix protein with protein kinase domain